MPIRVILSSYSMLSLSALMTVQNPQWRLPGPTIDTLVSFLGLALALIFPGLVLYIMLQNFKDFETRQFKASFGSLYEGLNALNKWIIAFRVWFIVRRLLISIIVVFAKNLIAQILLWFFQEIFSIIILGYGYPFERRSEWKTEMWNEVFILSTIYFTMFFSPYISNVDVLNGLGYCFCGLLFSHLIINIIFIGFVTIRQKLKEFKQWRIIRREKLRTIAYKKSNLKKKLALHQNMTLRRRLSVKGSHKDLIDELDGQKRYSRFQKSELLNRTEQRGLMIPQLLVNPNRTINKSSIVLEQIKESSESGSSCSSQLCESYQISDSEEMKREETEQIEEEGVGIQPVPRVRKNESLLDLKLKEINELVMSQKINQEDVLSEQTHDGEILQLLLSESNQAPFKLLRYNTYKEEQKDETMLKIQPRNKSPINLTKSTVDFKKRASLGQIIEDLEQQHNSRYDKTVDEEEFLRELSATYLDDPDANKDSIDELAQLQRNIDFITKKLSPQKKYQKDLSDNRKFRKNYFNENQKSTIQVNRKSQNNSPYREKLIKPNEGFALNRSVEQMTKPLKLKPETDQLFKSSMDAIQIQQAEPETKMLQQAVRRFTSMHHERKLSKSRDQQIFSKSLKPQNRYRSKTKEIIVLENSDYVEPSQQSMRDI